MRTFYKDPIHLFFISFQQDVNFQTIFEPWQRWQTITKYMNASKIANLDNVQCKRPYLNCTTFKLDIFDVVADALTINREADEKGQVNL